MSIEWISKNKVRLRVSVGSRQSRKTYSRTIEVSGKKDAKKKYEEFCQEVAGGVTPQKLTVSELVAMYVDHLEVIGTRATTMKGYKTCQRRIDKYIGNRKAQSMDKYDVDNFVAVMVKDHLSPKTIKNTISVLRSAYSYAKGRVGVNPCIGVDLPKTIKPDIKILDDESAAVFLRAVEELSADVKVGLYLALFMGLRRSEICGLTESDINFNFKTLYIKSGRHRLAGEDVIQDPKSSTSRRKLTVPPTLLKLIAELVQEHHSKPYQCSEYLIQDAFGDPIRPAELTDAVTWIVRENGLPHVTLHGLRHTYASYLFSGEANLVDVSRQIGHSLPSTTANLYLHVYGGATASSTKMADSAEDFMQQVSGSKKRVKIAK
ncbi:MAG: site-specific integrase [Clostridiales bacterium]|nr:site-specific integrase [Candidatus Crickella merdequi]